MTAASQCRLPPNSLDLLNPTNHESHTRSVSIQQLLLRLGFLNCSSTDIAEPTDMTVPRRYYCTVRWIGGGLVAASLLTALVLHALRAPPLPDHVWAKEGDFVLHTPDGDIMEYEPVTEHSAAFNLCTVSDSLGKAGLGAMEPKPLGDLADHSIRIGGSSIVSAWTNGPGRKDIISYVDSGVTLCCPKCGLLHLLIRHDLAPTYQRHPLLPGRR